MKTVGVTARGLICPIIRKGDNLIKIATESLLNAKKEIGFEINDRDIICITESIVARAQGNYATIDDIKKDVDSKFGENAELGLVLPIFSRNRFAICLKGIALSAKKIYIQLPVNGIDEVGNPVEHPITGVNYRDYYNDLCKSCNCDVEFITTASDITKFTENIIIGTTHTRDKIASKLKFNDKSNSLKVFTLADILSDKCEYGLLGSNKVDENTIKLFPSKPFEFVHELQTALKEATGKTLEVGIYGDGSFKSPFDEFGVSIWELADPVSMVGYTKGLEGNPNEIKIKYLADDKYKDLSGEELSNKIREEIKNKESDLTGNMKSQGTTPRHIRDLVGSLCDLVSGSGDKGTPIVYIQGYFSNYSE